MIKGSQDGILD